MPDLNPDSDTEAALVRKYAIDHDIQHIIATTERTYNVQPRQYGDDLVSEVDRALADGIDGATLARHMAAVLQAAAGAAYLPDRSEGH